MYPAQALADGLYTDDDLPDTIILELFNQLQPGAEYCPREVLSRSYDGYLYGYGNPLDATPGNKAARIGLFFSEEQQGWFFSYLQVEYKDPGAGAENRVYVGVWEDTCLLQDMSGELIIEDEFADTYTITTTFGFPSIAVERVSLCRWEMEYLDEGFDPPRLQIAYLEIQFADVTDFFGWYVSYGNESGYAEPVTAELGRLNTPIGDYGNVNDPPPRSIIFTVS
jgi:hypothetical protein